MDLTGLNTYQSSVLCKTNKGDSEGLKDFSNLYPSYKYSRRLNQIDIWLTSNKQTTNLDLKQIVL